MPADEDSFCHRAGWTRFVRAIRASASTTFWDYFRDHWPRNAGLRIDHLLLNEPAAQRLVDANVDTWVRGQAHASDHAPAWVELRDVAQSRRGPVQARSAGIEQSKSPTGSRVRE